MKKLGWILFYLSVFCLLVHNSFSYLDPDYGWHLAFGRDVAQTLSVPHDQVYLWTIDGQSWVDHEWLSNLITFAVSEVSGYIGVTIFFALLVVATLFIINRYVFRLHLTQPKERIALAIIEGVGIFAMLPHLGVRMQEWTVLLLALMLIVIDTVRRRRNWNVSLTLIPLLYLWSCLHGGFLIGVVLLIGWLGYEWLRFVIGNRITWTHDEALPKKVLFAVSIVVLVAIAATLATPYGLELYGFLNDYRQTFYLTHIQEWRSPYTIPLRYWQIGFLLVIAAGALGCRFFSKYKLPLWNIAVFLLLAIMASKSVRHFPLLAIASFIYIGPIALKPALEDIRVRLSKPVRSVALLCLGLAAISGLVSARVTNDPLRAYCDSYPCEAINFLKNHEEYARLRLFNNYNWGGFMIGAWPEKQLFIDGRLPQYDFKGRTMLEEYSDFFSSAKAQAKLDEYGIELVLIQKKPTAPKLDWFETRILGYTQNQFTPSTALNDLLAASADWKTVYDDSVSIIYVRL